MPTTADLKKAHLNFVNKKIRITPINSDRSTLTIYESRLVNKFDASSSAERFHHAIRETRINKTGHGATLSTAVRNRNGKLIKPGERIRNESQAFAEISPAQWINLHKVQRGLEVGCESQTACLVTLVIQQPCLERLSMRPLCFPPSAGPSCSLIAMDECHGSHVHSITILIAATDG
jgi:hypothetical protein